jgi:alanyl-tRNA synthetase
MNGMGAREIRRTFLDFFVGNGHTAVPSASLVPADDPTLLFVNAGMVPFKEALAGREERPYRRAVSAQRCLRVSGKHNDLEEVGPSPRHHTFFEMLGSFSFGDYAKPEAIRLAWQLLTAGFGLPVERLWFTVFAGDELVPPDEEAARLWVEAGAPPERVLRFGEENFWAMGDSGPCGPSSEITVYIGDDVGAMDARGVNSPDPDYVEIWNLVFPQFERGAMRPLPRPAVDTGMGLERMAMVLQGVRATYDTDLFRPIVECTLALTGGDEDHYRAHLATYRAIADHSRACAFLIADGVLPGNEGRPYVLRRILRRAAYQGRTLGLRAPFLAETATVVVETMGDAYPELRRHGDTILATLTAEEERFGRAVRGGLALLDRALARTPPGSALPGAVAFALHDTHGFPLDLTRRIVAERGRTLDEAGFAAALEAQRRRNSG